MQPQPVVRRLWLYQSAISSTTTASRRTTILTQRSLSLAQAARISTRCRPTISFLYSPATSPSPVRTYASQRPKTWLHHQAKLLVRYALISWAGMICISVIYFFYDQEKLERVYPTPHEWGWRERKMLRHAHRCTDPENRESSWAKVHGIARNLCLALEDPKRQGNKIPRLHDHEDPNDEVPWEFIPHDLSGVSEEWRRAYFETIMLTAKAAGCVDGHLTDGKSKYAWPPEFVIGPSNPRPRPIPPGSPPAPREEDCELACPPADRYYLKILATKGLSPRQKMEAALEYASFIETKRQPQSPKPLYNLALAEATQGMDQTKLPFNSKTLVLKDNGPAPSQNILDAITAIANHKARNGNAAAALPIYVSLLKARRSLSDTPPRIAQPPKPRLAWHQQLIKLLAQPDYPPPPPDGTQPPWRSPEERCQEASLNLYIGEILYTSSSREDGVAWTREGVDIAEQELRELSQSGGPVPAKDRCRECLKTGLDNWAVMVARLAQEEQLRRESKPGVFSFWSSGSSRGDAEGRWAAEGAVVEERTKRTNDMVEDLKPLPEGIMRYLKA